MSLFQIDTEMRKVEVKKKKNRVLGIDRAMESKKGEDKMCDDRHGFELRCGPLSYSVYPAAELRRQLLSTKFQIPNSDGLGF